MSESHERLSELSANVSLALTRLVRHEVGDLLQTLYSAVALLKERLPPEMHIERRILGDMRGRAESCKDLLETIHDLMMPLRIEWQEYDLQELAENLVTWARSRYPQLEVRLESEAMPPVPGDPQRLMQVGRALLSNACAAARRQVVCRVGPEGDQTVSWSIRDDGPGLPPEQTAQLFTDLALSSRDRLVPGLVLAGRLIALHGGQIKAENRPEGGLLVHVVLPMKKDEG